MIGWLVAITALGCAGWYWRDRPSHREAMTQHQHPLVLSGTARIVAEKRRSGELAALYAAGAAPPSGSNRR